MYIYEQARWRRGCCSERVLLLFDAEIEAFDLYRKYIAYIPISDVKIHLHPRNPGGYPTASILG